MKKRLLLLLILLLGIHATNPAFGEDAPHGFFLGPSGQFSIDPNETIEGRRSVVGKYQGSGSYNQFLITDPNVFPLHPGKTYTVRFKYKILATPDKGFEVLFYSPKGGAANVWLPSKTFTGKTDDQGKISLTNTLGPYDDYRIVWNIVGQGAIAVDSVSLCEEVTSIPLTAEEFEEPALSQGLLPFEITDTMSLPLGSGEGQIYVLRSANVRDLDGDGSGEVVLTITTYNDQLPEPIIILGAVQSSIKDCTGSFFPNGIPKLKHSPYILFPDLNRDGRDDLVFAEAGLDHEPWTGSRMVIALQEESGCFRDVSDQIPEELWSSRSYSTAVGDLDADGLPEVLLPDQLGGRNTVLLTWKDGAFTAKRNWISEQMWMWPEKLRANNCLCIADLDDDGFEDIIVGGGWERPNLRLIFGGPEGFTRITPLPDGIFGHTVWEEWQREDTPSAQGADIIGLVAADLDNDGLKDIFSVHEQVLLYKPGAITDTLEPEYRPVLERGGQIYADTAIQVFKNRGNRVFEEISPASSSSMLGRRYYLSIIPLDLNGDGFLDIVGGYWTKRYDKQRGGLKGTTVFLNDGTGAFQTIDGSVLFPVKAANRAVDPEQLGIFVPTRLDSTRLDGLFITSSNWNNSGTLTARKGYYRGVIGTGPGLADSARLGFPGYNEFYYLRTHPDAAAAVKSGQYQNGLGHYKAVGVRRGYQTFAANATIRGSVGGDTLILPIRMQDARISVIEGGWRRLVDATRKYGTLRIRGVERIQFLDGVKGL